MELEEKPKIPGRKSHDKYQKIKYLLVSLAFMFLASSVLLPVVYYIVNEETFGSPLSSKAISKRSTCTGKNCDIEKKGCPSPREKHPVCMTKDCTLTAATLLSAMDSSLDPCEDFNLFACGNYIRTNLVPDNKNRMTTYLQYEDNYLLQQRYLIEEYNSFGEPNVVFRLQEAYHVCINISYNSKEEINEFEKYLLHELDVWPMAEGSQWKPEHDTFDDYVSDLYLNETENYLLHINLNEEFNGTKNTTANIATISVRPMYNIRILSSTLKVIEDENLQENATEKEKIIHRQNLENKKLMFYLLKLFGEFEPEFVAEELTAVVDFHRSLVDLMEVEKASSEDGTRMMIQELNDATNNTIDWLKIFNAKFHGKVSFNLSDEIDVVNIASIEQLPEVLRSHSLRAFVNLVAWEKINDMLGILPLEMKKEFLVYQGKKEFKMKENSRWRRCLYWITKTYPGVLNRMFVKTFVDRKSIAMVEEMIQFVQEAYKEEIKQSVWLDKKTKEKAIRKADAIRRNVGFPEYILNDTAIEHEYSYLPEVKSTHFRNAVEMNPRTEKKRKEIMEGRTDRWFMSPMMINAFYFPRGNSIWFPFGILQLPFFGANRLAAVNFGMIGRIIGHEIGHAFDIHGSRYNERGEEEYWWSEEMYELYEERAECFINQYDQYCPEFLQGGFNDTEICISGSLTLGENMADNTGIRAAFEAYKLWVKKYGKEKRLPGLQEYSPEQLFFISAGYIWCENIPADKWLKLYGSDPHSPARYRTLGAMSNNEEFRKAFNCPRGRMNREHESCVLW